MSFARIMKGSLETMQIRLRTSGGLGYFPGIARPIEISTEALPEDQRRALEELVERSAFFSLPTDERVQPDARDDQVHTLTIEAGDRRHTVRRRDSNANADFLDLIETVRRSAKANPR